MIEANHDETGIIWPEPWRRSASASINLQLGDAACDAAWSTEL